MEAQAVVARLIGIVVVLFVPALVWLTVVAGLYQMARGKMRESRKTFARKLTVTAK